LELTEPVAASRFATIAEANAFCSARFGREWRVADFMEGGRGFVFTATARQQVASQRAWVDIRDQPYGACWRRE
jgi:hypothetical protein